MRFLVLLFSFWVHLAVLVRALLWTLPGLLLQLLFGSFYGDSKTDAQVRPYIALLSFIEWDGAWQRPQHLMSEFSRKMNAVYCAPVRAHNVGFRSLAFFFSDREEVSASLTVLRPMLLPFENRSGMIRAINTFIVFRSMQKEIKSRGRIPTVLMTNSPFFALPFSWLPARVRAYDVMDELVRFGSAPPNSEGMERLVVSQSDVVTTGTWSLSQLKQRQYEDILPEAHYVACGAEAAHFAREFSEDEIPDDIASLPKPIIGYFGAINERMDPELLLSLSEKMPKASIVLIGPVYQRFRSYRIKGKNGEALLTYPLLKQKPNVYFLGMKPYEELPKYLAAFDCAIVPYRLSDGVEFVQPVKTLEYMAGGKPVVSTAIPDVVKFMKDLVRVGETHDDFVQKVSEAIVEGGDRSEEYRVMAAQRSWTDMADEFENHFLMALDARLRGPRNVVHLLHGENFGGAEELVLNLCQSYDSTKTVASVICLAKGRITSRRLQASRVDWKHVPMEHRRDLAVVFPMISVLRARRCDVIHTHTGRTNLLGRLAGRIAGIPVVSTVHTAVARDINDVGQSNRLNAWIDKRTRKWSDRLVTVSRHNRAELIDQGAPEDKVYHIPNGIQTMFPIPSFDELSHICHDIGMTRGKEPVIGMLASMRPRKGPEILIQAMPAILEKYPGTQLLMVGSGEFVKGVDYLQKLKDLTVELGIGDYVIFTGHRDNARTMLALMDVVVLPSLYGEGMPLSILEAMSLGKAVVATRTEGNEELVRHEETGLLVEPNDSGAIAEAVCRLLGDMDNAQRMGWQGRKIIEQEYDILKVAELYSVLYEDTLQKEGRL